MTLQIQVSDGLFKYGACVVGAQKIAKKELQKVTEGGCSEVELVDFTTNEIKYFILMHKLVECCKTSQNTMKLLETRYKQKVAVGKEVDIEIANLHMVKSTTTPLANTQSFDVHAFVWFVESMIVVEDVFHMVHLWTQSIYTNIS